jgi:hypothetical protein
MQGGTLSSAGPNTAPRSCIFFLLETVHDSPLSQIRSRDVKAVGMTYTRRGSKREVMLPQHTSPMIQTNHPPTKGLQEVVDYCGKNKLQLIVGCDTNAHHIIWGSADINPRGEWLMEYLVSTNLNILNKSNEPTFGTSNRHEGLT